MMRFALRDAIFLAALFLATATGCRFDGSGLGRMVATADAAADAPVDGAAQPDRPREGGSAPDRRLGEGGTEADCLDGKDDDGDGRVDCADADCTAGYECVPAAPASMGGYYRLRQGAWNDPLASCADGSSAERFGSGPLQLQCGSCACGALSGTACGYPPIHRWTNGSGDCASGAETDETATLGQIACYGGTATGNNAVKVMGPATVTTPGSCPASGGAPVSTPPFEKQLLTCGAASGGGGCGAGVVCVPRAPGGFDAKVCHRVSSGSCGAGWRSLVGHTGWKDERTCAACGCTPAGTTCKGGKYTFYGDNKTCDGSGCNTPVDVAPGGSCQAFGLQGTTSYSVKAERATVQGGSCAVSGGQPEGSIKSTPVTFCCPE